MISQNKVGWIVLVALIVLVTANSLSYLGREADPNATDVLIQLRDRPIQLLTHIVFSTIALIFSPFQLSSKVRARRPKLHRNLGRAYLFAVAIGGIAGFAVGLYSYAGPIARWGFCSLAILWLLTTFMAYFQILKRNIKRHQEWMIRSAALTFAAITLRIYVGLSEGVLVPVTEISFQSAYIGISWLAWVPNLIVAEIYIRKNRTSRHAAV